MLERLRYNDDVLEKPTPSKSSFWTLIKPSFLQSRNGFDNHHDDRIRLRPTSWLDGLRGLAAFLVYVMHHIGVAHDFGAPISTGYGKDGRYALLNFPFLRLFFSGAHFAVPLFFVISGYVLAQGPLRRIRSGEGQLSDFLASAIFRRGIRLWLPVIGTTLTYVLLRHVGIWADSFSFKLRPTLIQELRAYVTEFLRFTFVLRIQENPFVDLTKSTFSYNPHTWTIALEYQGSILLFIVLLAFSSLPGNRRMFLTAVLALYFILQGSWVFFCFLSGAIMAEIDLLDLHWLRDSSRSHRVYLYALLIMGLWLGGMPTVELRAQTKEDLASNPGWAFLAALVPSRYEDIKPFWLSWAAVFSVFAIGHLGRARAVFETSLLQYMGKISFAFYLVHGPVLQIVATRVYHMTGQRLDQTGSFISKYDNWFHLPSSGPFGLETSFLAAHLIILPITVYCSDVAYRAFDAPSVQLARRCYRMLLT